MCIYRAVQEQNLFMQKAVRTRVIGALVVKAVNSAFPPKVDITQNIRTVGLSHRLCLAIKE